MREASPFRINTTHAHRASIYLYETRRIELSSSPGHEHFISPFFLSLSFPLAILAAQEVAKSAKIRGFGSTVRLPDLDRSSRSARLGIIGDRLCLEMLQKPWWDKVYSILSVWSIEERKRSVPKSSDYSFIFEDLSVKCWNSTRISGSPWDYYLSVWVL